RALALAGRPGAAVLRPPGRRGAARRHRRAAHRAAGMKLRIAAIAFLIAVLTVGLCWLSLQPLLARLLEVLERVAAPGSPEHALLARTARMLPLLLGVHLAAGGALVFAVLYLTVARPLGRA